MEQKKKPRQQFSQAKQAATNSQPLQFRFLQSNIYNHTILRFGSLVDGDVGLLVNPPLKGLSRNVLYSLFPDDVS